MFTIYHNPRCSKSRQTLALLEENGIVPKVVLYLEDNPDAGQITALLKMLDISPRDLLRRSEEEYKALGLSDNSLSDAVLIKAMAEHPKLIERPIVVKGSQAVLGRPPENVLSLIE